MPPESPIRQLNPERADYGMVQETVDRVLRENAVTKPPIRIFEIVRRYELDVAFAQFSDYSTVAGYIDIEARRIVISEREIATRQKFTVAHELGHWLMHRELIKSDPDKGVLLRNALDEPNPDPLEKEANAFAARLLVPSSLLDKYRGIVEDSTGFIGDEAVAGSSRMFANIFGVSRELMSYRLRDGY